MAFLGAGKLNGIAKRSHGVEQFFLLNLGGTNNTLYGKPAQIYNAIPGTGSLKIATGPQAQYLTGLVGSGPNNNGSAISPDGVWLTQSLGSAGYPWFQLYQKVNGVYQAYNMTGLSLPASPISSIQFQPVITLSSPYNYYILTLTSTNLIYYYVFSSGSWVYAGSTTIYSSSINGHAWDPTGNFVVVSGGVSGGVSLQALYVNTSSKTLVAISSVTSGFSSLGFTQQTYVPAFSPQNNLMAVGGLVGTAPNQYVSLFSYTTTATGITFTKTPWNPGITVGNSPVYTVAFNNTSSGYINTASLAIGGGFTNVYVVDLALNGSSTVAYNTASVSIIGSNQYTTAWNNSGTHLITGGIGGLNVLQRTTSTGYTKISSGTIITQVYGVFPNSVNNIITVQATYPPYYFEYNVNYSTNTLTALDSWGRIPYGFTATTTGTFMFGQAQASAAANFYAGSINPVSAGLNPPGMLLTSTIGNSAGYLQVFYYDYLNTNNFYPIPAAQVTVPTASASTNHSWSNNGYFTLIQSNSPYINNYYVSGGGTGTNFYRLAQPVDSYGGLPTTISNNNSGPFATYSNDSSILVISGFNATTNNMAFYSVNYAGTSTVYTRGTGTQFSSYPIATTFNSAFSPDGTLLAVATASATSPIALYNVSYAGTLTTFTSTGTFIGSSGSGNYYVTWSPDGKWLAAMSQSNNTRDALIYSRSGTTFTLKSPNTTNPSEIAWRGQFSNDSATFYIFDETNGQTSSSWPGISALKYSSQTNTWTYSVSNATIEHPFITAKINWRVDI